MREMDYEDFYCLSEWANENWKGSFSPKDVAVNAYEYKTDYDFAREVEANSAVIDSLLDQLDEDGSEEAKEWAERIREDYGNW